jgi:glycosyltransferase involved in cell wall biosynthesis
MDRLAILTNIVAPYRVPVYRKLGQRFQTKVFFSGREGNRGEWKRIESALYPDVDVEKSWGVTIPYPDIRRHGIYQHRYLHVNPGYLWDLASFRPDAIISNEMGVRSLLALLYGRLTNTPVWIWWGGTLHTERDLGLPRKVVRVFFRRHVRSWISYGETSTEYLKDLGVCRESIVQIQNCVDDRRFREETEPVLNPCVNPALLFVGQLIERKGVEPLLRAASVLQKEGLSFSLHIVGDGERRESLQKLRERLGLDHVRFHGTFSPEQMPGVYESMDTLVFPSLEDVWGLVVNEALWSGLPVLGSTYAGCSRELLPPENVCDPRDHEDFVDGLRRAVKGDLAPPDLDRLWTHEEVVDFLASEIQAEIEKSQS